MAPIAEFGKGGRRRSATSALAAARRGAISTGMERDRRTALRTMLAIALATALPAAALPWPAKGEAAAFPAAEIAIVTAGGRHPFRVELAATPEQRIQGLQGRRSLAAGAGMLFRFDPPEAVAMWMKNTYVPLDMLFIDRAGRIVGIAEDTVPLSLELIRAPQPVTGVVEVNAGTVRRLGIRVGDRIVGAGFPPR
jgi:uncharacterized membrane protein (UPF0127 family)